MKITSHPDMPSKEQMRRWREGHREVERIRRLEWGAMSDAQRLHMLEQLYGFIRLLGLHQRNEETINLRWHKIKQRWLQKNPNYCAVSLLR